MSDPNSQPAATGIAPGHFTPSPVEPGHDAPCPRRIRGLIGSEVVIDSMEALYYWESPFYPHYLIRVADIAEGVIPDDALKVVDETKPDHRMVTWSAIDHWFEEEEEVFVHPRSPYVRADAVRSNRRVRVELNGTVLADAPSSIIVFETGLPPRYYLDKTSIYWSNLTLTDTETACPYKGITSNYWNANIDGEEVTDIAWGYDFPMVSVAPIAGLVAFYDEKVEITLG